MTGLIAGAIYLVITFVVVFVIARPILQRWHRRREQKIDAAVVIALQVEGDRLLENRMSAKMRRQGEFKRTHRRRRI